MTNGIKISAQKLKDLHILAVEGNQEIKNYYKKYKSVYRQVINKAKKMHNTSIMSRAENKSKAAWAILNSNKKATKQITSNLN